MRTCEFSVVPPQLLASTTRMVFQNSKYFSEFYLDSGQKAVKRLTFLPLLVHALTGRVPSWA